MAKTHYSIVFLCLMAIAIFAGGCSKKPEFDLPADGISRFPTGEVLEEGDVILARSYGLIGAMFANYSMENGDGTYSHGAMVYRAQDGVLMMLNYRPTGMETCRPEEFFTRYNRLALLRYKGDFGEACAPAYTGNKVCGVEALNITSRWWLEKNARERVPPDYRLNHDEQSAMFCLELTSTVYRDCGLPDPFFKARKTEDDPLLTIANRLFKADVMEIRSPSSALENPDFEVLGAWLRPEFDLREEALNEELMRVAIGDIENGMWPRRPNILGRMKLRQIFAVYHFVTTVMFWRPKQDLPDFIDTDVIDNAYMLYKYVALSKKLAKKRMALETRPVYAGDPDPEGTLGAVRRIVRESLDCYRDKYMYFPVERPTGACTPCG